MKYIIILLFFLGGCNFNQHKNTGLVYLPKGDERLEFFEKDSIIELDSMNAIYQYDSIRFYWNGFYNYYIKLPNSYHTVSLFDHAGSGSFESKDRKMKISAIAMFNLAEITRWQAYKDILSGYERSGYTLSMRIFKDSLFIFSGQLDSLMFYRKIVYYPYDRNTDVFSSVELEYIASRQNEANKIINEVIKLFPNRPF